MVFSWQMAQELAVAHMRSLGFEDVKRVADGAHEGVVVTAAGAVAQVKTLGHPVGSRDIGRLRTVGRGNAHALFYSLSGYSAAALAAADDGDVRLFEFTAANDVMPVNTHAWAAGSAMELLIARVNVLVAYLRLVQFKSQAFVAAGSEWVEQVGADVGHGQADHAQVATVAAIADSVSEAAAVSIDLADAVQQLNAALDHPTVEASHVELAISTGERQAREFDARIAAVLAPLVNTEEQLIENARQAYRDLTSNEEHAVLLMRVREAGIPTEF